MAQTSCDAQKQAADRNPRNFPGLLLLVNLCRAALVEWQSRLEPALRSLKGLRHYYVAVDPKTYSLTNVSVWESLEAAEQMNTLAVMLEQRQVFEGLGVSFDPIRNHTTLWAIEP